MGNSNLYMALRCKDKRIRKQRRERTVHSMLLHNHTDGSSGRKLLVDLSAVSAGRFRHYTSTAHRMGNRKGWKQRPFRLFPCEETYLTAHIAPRELSRGITRIQTLRD